MLRLQSVKEKPGNKVVALGGDGIGPEVVSATVQVLKSLEPELEISEPIHGSDAVAKGLGPLPDATKEEIAAAGVVIFGAVDTETGNAVSLLRHLRFHSDCYANIRPVRPLSGVAHRLGSEKANIIVVRELTEGMYPGREGTFEEWGAKLEGFKDRLGRPLPKEGRFSIRVTTEKAVKRIADYAAKLAVGQDRPTKITIVTKKNVLRDSDGMFAQLSKEVITGVSSDIQIEEQYIDDACRRLVSNTDDFDIVLLPNLFGDIFSDIATEVMGGMGLAPSAAIGSDLAYFEGCHGSAPDIAGKNIANPTATLLSAAMMLEYMGRGASAKRLVDALERCFVAGKTTTDLGGSLGTDAFTNTVIEEL